METSTAPSSSQQIAPSGPPSETVDTRGMEPPQPILAILKKIGELPKNGTLEVCLDNLPMQLYDLVQQRGFFLISQKQPDGTYIGQVRPRNFPEAH